DDVAGGDPLQRGDLGVAAFDGARAGVRVGEGVGVVVVEPVGEVGIVQLVVDGAVVEAQPVDRLHETRVEAGGAVVHVGRAGAVDEVPVGPRRPGHGGVPVVADGVLRSQRIDDGQLVRRVIALHDIAAVVRARYAGVLRGARGVVGDEAGQV